MIDKLSTFVQAAARSTTAGSKPSNPARASRGSLGTASDATPTRPSIAELEARVRRQILQIRPDDPRRRQRALRVLVETSLSGQFGPSTASDPEFHALVDRVTRTIDDDPKLQGLITDALTPFLIE